MPRETMPSDKTDMPTTKGLLASKTFWGVIVMLVAARSREWLGVDLNDLLGAEFVESLAVVVGATIAVYGRVKAGTKVDDVW